MNINQLADQYTKTAKELMRRKQELKKRMKNGDYIVGDKIYSRINVISTEYNSLIRTAGHLRKYARRMGLLK
ncbi:MAG: hypothetical protein FWG69_05315 [Oscillospiraceae bacterium]|nr:hypothetical protein [Oscillospiraceae bacterium]